MSIDEILEVIDDLIDRAWAVPLSGGRCMVDAEKLRQLIDDVRLNMPTEIKQARAIVADRNEIIGSARKEAENIIRRSEERAAFQVSESEIVKVSQEKAMEIVSTAQLKARELRNASNEFVENILKVTETTLIENLGEIRNARQTVRNTKLEIK